jgi:hypothetical protein
MHTPLQFLLPIKVPKRIRYIMAYCKPPNICPGLIFVRKDFWWGLIFLTCKIISFNFFSIGNQHGHHAIVFQFSRDWLHASQEYRGLSIFYCICLKLCEVWTIASVKTCSWPVADMLQNIWTFKLFLLEFDRWGYSLVNPLSASTLPLSSIKFISSWRQTE